MLWRAMKQKTKLTPEQVDGCRKMRNGGATWTRIAEVYGVDATTVRRAVDPGYAEFRRQQVARNRKYSTAGQVSISRPLRSAGQVSGAKVNEDAMQRLAEIPPDTRDLTGLLMGDPIPNDPRRSA